MLVRTFEKHNYLENRENACNLVTLLLLQQSFKTSFHPDS